MARIDEPRLKAELKAGKPSRVYFLFGEEKYLVKMYADKIISSTVGGGTDEMNFMKFGLCGQSAVFLGIQVCAHKRS